MEEEIKQRDVYTDDYARLLSTLEDESIDAEFIESYAFNHELKLKEVPWSSAPNKTMPWVRILKNSIFAIDQNYHLRTKSRGYQVRYEVIT